MSGRNFKSSYTRQFQIFTGIIIYNIVMPTCPYSLAVRLFK